MEAHIGFWMWICVWWIAHELKEDHKSFKHMPWPKKDHPFVAIKLVDYLKKFVNNHIHWGLPNCKHFGTLHAFCSMREFVKWTCHLKLYNALVPNVSFNYKTTYLVTWKCSPSWNCHFVSWKNVNTMWEFQPWSNCSLMFIKNSKFQDNLY